MINRYFGLVGRFFFLAFVLGSVQNLNVAQTATQGDQKDRLPNIKFVDTPIKTTLVALCTSMKLDVVFDDSVEDKEVTIQDLYPDLSLEQQVEAEYNLKQYVAFLVWRIPKNLAAKSN